MKSQKIRGSYLFRWLFLALIFRVLYFLIFLALGNDGKVGDSSSYLQVAEWLRAGNGIGETARTLGYPLVLAFFQAIFGDLYYYFLVLFQIGVNLIAIFYVFCVSNRLFENEKVAHVALIIASCNFSDIRYTCLVLTDSLSQSISLIAIAYFLDYLCALLEHRTDRKSLLFGSVLLSVAVSIRPALVYLPAALIVGFAGIAIWKKQAKSILAVVLCIGAICYTPVVLWTAHNVEVSNYYGYSTIQDENLYEFNAAAVWAKQHQMTYHAAHEALQKGEDEAFQEYLQTMSRYDAFHQRGKEIIASDVPYYITYLFRDAVYLFFYPAIMDVETVRSALEAFITQVKVDGLSIHSLLSHLSAEDVPVMILVVLDVLLLGALLLCFVIGLTTSFKRQFAKTLLFAGVILYFIVVCIQPVGIGAYPRFRLSLSMFTTLFSAYGMVWIWEKRSLRFDKRVRNP